MLGHRVVLFSVFKGTSIVFSIAAVSIYIPTNSARGLDRKSTRLNSSHITISYAVFCLKKKNKKLKIELPYDPAIPLLGIYPEETIIQKESCTIMFIAALFTTARTWKQPKRPSTDEWIKKMWHIYTTEYYSAIKRNEIELFVVRWMDLEAVIQSEVSQKEKNKYRMLTHIYGIKKKLFLKNGSEEPRGRTGIKMQT